MTRTASPDAVDAAIQTAEQPPKQVQRMVQTPIKIASTGRVVVVSVPPDITDAEAIEWTAWFLGTLIPDLRARHASPLVLAVAGRA